MEIPAAKLTTPGQPCLHLNLIENFSSPARIASSDSSIPQQQEDISVVTARAITLAMKYCRSAPVAVIAKAVSHSDSDAWTSSCRLQAEFAGSSPPEYGQCRGFRQSRFAGGNDPLSEQPG